MDGNIGDVDDIEVQGQRKGFLRWQEALGFSTCLVINRDFDIYTRYIEGTAFTDKLACSIKRIDKIDAALPDIQFCDAR